MDTEVSLRAVTGQDVAEFFAHRQQRGDAGPEDHDAFLARWQHQLQNPDVTLRTILADAEVVGYIARFTRNSLPEVSYELGPDYWGHGFATAALRLFVAETTARPLYARAAKDNARSLRVLEKNGFRTIGEDRFIAAAGNEVEEFVLMLS
ncbi:MAG TPA: GNAT family N-acetyltransferase [Steroidobacteraceae bacterium]|nr:GNAT family N-acetyltransferase [Steroidobacteraceae bacterium]